MKWIKWFFAPKYQPTSVAFTTQWNPIGAKMLTLNMNTISGRYPTMWVRR